MYTVYMHINRVNGKKYVGYTSKSWQSRWKDHCKSAKSTKHFYFHAAIHKYGVDAFDHVVLAADIATLADAHMLERKFIAEHNTHASEYGYNLTYGGEGCAATPSTRAKMSKSLRGNEKLRATLRGRTFSDEHRANIGAVHRGRKRSAETCARLSASHKAPRVPRTAETKAKLSAALRAAWMKRKQHNSTLCNGSANRCSMGAGKEVIWNA